MFLAVGLLCLGFTAAEWNQVNVTLGSAHMVWGRFQLRAQIYFCLPQHTIWEKPPSVCSIPSSNLIGWLYTTSRGHTFLNQSVWKLKSSLEGIGLKKWAPWKKKIITGLAKFARHPGIKHMRHYMQFLYWGTYAIPIPHHYILYI